jgi:hypothetical protein
MKQKTFSARQGDIWIEEVKLVPNSAKPVDKAGKDRIILALGEVTHHHHSLDIAAADWWKDDTSGDQFLTVNTKTSVTHQEHGAIVLAPKKTYRVIRQREYVPKQLPRQVAD